ncbi:MAG: GGDEF domain-containing protein, partial [Deltaproteobacteria bacterium]|nr:GGDEF domain-containing protein [Deltaproteobacteria bacterium]
QVAIAYSRTMLYMKTKELSVTDDLTGVFNRRHFQQVLRMEWKRASRFERPLSLLMIDADHFKSFNDRFGHLVGDKILKQLAQLLLRNVREVDAVARFGGEEFVVVLADTELKDAVAVAEKLRKLVETGEDLPDGVDFDGLTVSIGVSSYPEMADSEEELINTADLALYQAKGTGRNRVKGYEVDRIRENGVRRPGRSLWN